MQRLSLMFKSFEGNHREKTPQEYASILYNEVLAALRTEGADVRHAAIVTVVSIIIDVAKAHDKTDAVYYWNSVWAAVISAGFEKIGDRPGPLSMGPGH